MSSKTPEFESLLEAVPDALVGMDQAGVIRFVNHQTESLFGYDRDDLVGQPIQRLVPEYLWEVYSEHREEYFTDPRSRSMGLDLQLNGRQQDGTEVPVNISLSHLDTGDVLLVITGVHEVARHRRELENAQLLAAIVEHSNDAIIAKTLDGIVTSWNPAAERMYGYSSEEMLGTPIDRLSLQGRTGEITSILARIKAGQDIDPVETVRVRKDGTTFPILLTASPIRDASGAVVGASTISRDITKEKEAFAAARDVTEQTQAARYSRSLLEAALDPLVTISATGMITDVNEATVNATGLTRAQLVGTSFSEYFTEPERANEGYQLVFDQGSVTDYPLTLRHRDGTLTEVLYNASLYRDDAGNVLGVFAVARDVTEHKLALAEIAHQAKELERLADLERTRSMIESSLDALVAISPEGLITDANAATVKATGVPREELVGTTFSDCFTEPDRAERIYQMVFKQGMAVDYPLTLRHRDGTLTEVLYNASVYHDAAGKVLGVFAAARDVTNQNQAHKAIAQQQATALDRLAELERFQRLTVGRELKMIELKKEVEHLRSLIPPDETESGDPR